jgi:hypothetical protein
MEKLRIFITGDQHGERGWDRLSPEDFPQGGSLTKNDYVIVTGDFGAVWFGDARDSALLDKFEALPFTILFVDGNHENFDLLNGLPVELWQGGKVHRLRESILHLTRGQVFEIAGKTFFTFGGAASPNKAELTEGVNWWRAELPEPEETEEGIRNLERHNRSVDHIITHTAPSRLLSELEKLCGYAFLPSITTQYLDMLYETVSFKNWYLGHFHLDVPLAPKVEIVRKRFIELTA